MEKKEAIRRLGNLLEYMKKNKDFEEHSKEENAESILDFLVNDLKMLPPADVTGERLQEAHAKKCNYANGHEVLCKWEV